MCLTRQIPKVLIEEMPLIKIIPIEVNKLKIRGTFETPVYITSNRRDAMGRGLVFESRLPTEEHDSHWILQGTCMVLNKSD